MTNRQLQAQEYLNQYAEAVRCIKRRTDEYERESLLIDAIRSTSDNDGMPHGTNIGRPTEAKAIRLADKSLRIVEARLEAVRVRQEIYDTIDRVGGVDADVLYQRYIKLHGWEDIYPIVNYSKSQTRVYHLSGLNKVADILGIE